MKLIVERVSVALCFTLLLTVFGCSTEASKGAAQGAKAGAAVGAVGGMVSALVFGGDIVDGAARGAVWGGSTGAASGAMQGAQVADQNRAAEEQKVAAELEKLRKEIGDDAFHSLEALVDCKLPVAVAYAETAQGNSKSDYALAGYWLEALALEESGRAQDAEALLPELVAKDNKLNTEESARALLSDATQELAGIREYYGLPSSCS